MTNVSPKFPAIAREDRCGRCRFWGRDVFGSDRSFQSGPACKRYAPRAGAEPPWRRADDWCGEFERREHL